MCQDRDALLDLSYNVKKLQAAGLSPATSWNNVIPAGFARWWLDPQSADQGDSAKYFKYTPDEAKKLLTAAGADGATFDYHYSPTVYGTTFTNIAEAIGNYMQAIGLKPHDGHRGLRLEVHHPDVPRPVPRRRLRLRDPVPRGLRLLPAPLRRRPGQPRPRVRPADHGPLDEAAGRAG